LDNCKKCSHDLREHKAKYNLRGLNMPVTGAASEAPVTVAAENIATLDSADDEVIDFGFDFLEEQEEQAEENQERIALGSDDQDISLDQAFGFDNEAVPGEAPAKEKDKSEKGPEFAF